MPIRPAKPLPILRPWTSMSFGKTKRAATPRCRSADTIARPCRSSVSASLTSPVWSSGSASAQHSCEGSIYSAPPPVGRRTTSISFSQQYSPRTAMAARSWAPITALTGYRENRNAGAISSSRISAATFSRALRNSSEKTLQGTDADCRLDCGAVAVMFRSWSLSVANNLAFRRLSCVLL